MPSSLLRLCPPRWLGVCLALLTGAFAAQAQIHPAPGFNLFGDELVKKLSAQNGAFVIPGLEPVPSKAEENAQGFAHALVFQDGTQIRGEILSLTKEEILWSRPDVSEPLRFRRGDVRRIVLTPTESYRSRWIRSIPRGQTDPEDKTKSGLATVKLSGGDWLHGELSSADGNSFNLKLGEQTSFTLTRDAIAWLHSGPAPAPAFGFSGGPLDMEGWLSHSPGAQMEIKGGTLTVSGADWIGRQVTSLRRFEMSFELPADAEEGTQVWLQPYRPSVNSYTMGTVEMRLGRKAFQHCIFAIQMNRVSTPLPHASEDDKRPVRYRILYDGLGERLVVIRNGQQLGEWPFLEKEWANNQHLLRNFSISGICFQRRAGWNRPLKLNRVQFLPWDGSLTHDSIATGEGDCLLSSGGKSRAGRLESLSQSELQFSGEKLERNPGTLIRFAQDPTPLADVDAMLLFGEQGELSTAGLEIRDGTASFRTAFAAALEAPVANLQTIAFPTRSVPLSPKSSDILVFKNGDEIAGFLVSAAHGEPWRWQTLTGQEISIQPSYIAGFRSLAGSGASAKQANAATVEFRNGDRLRGELTGFREGAVQFRHGQLGDFSLPPAHLWSLYPAPTQSVMDGAQDPETWLGLHEEEEPDTFDFAPSPVEPDGANRWIYLDGRYVMRPEFRTSSYSSLGLVAPHGPRPERFELRFDVTSIAGEQPSCSLTFTSKQELGTLRAQIFPGSFHVNTFSRKTRKARSKQAQFAGRLQEPTSRFNVRVFVDSKTGTADFFLNGVFLARMGQQDAERLPGLGDGIRLQPNAYNGPVIFSNIWIGPWNGELPQAGTERTTATSLTNGDIAEGVPTSFRDGKVTLDTAIGPIDVPLEKLLAVEFGGAMSTKSAAARVRLADGSALSVDTFRWEGTQFIGQSEVLGNLQIPAKLITELALSPAPPRPPMNPPARKTTTREGNHGR